ncbi:MAG: BON domain-containing protein [Devosia sp.]
MTLGPIGAVTGGRCHGLAGATRLLVVGNGLVSVGRVTLRGKVRSWTERMEAEQAAWRAPGVLTVNDQVTIGI